MFFWTHEEDPLQWLTRKPWKMKLAVEAIQLQRWAVQACQHTCVLTWQGGREDRCTESSHWPSRSPSHSTQGHTCHSGCQRCCGHSSGIPRFKRRGKQQETVRTPSHLETAQQHPQFTSVDSFFLILKGAFLVIF